MKKNKKNKILNISNLLMVILFIFGIFIGSSMFPTTKIVTVSASNGDYCYNTDKELYVGNSVNYLPTNWQTKGISHTLCNDVNPSFSSCVIGGVNPSYATNKITCLCLK